MRFENVYTASPVCSAARTSWLTGVHTPTHGVWMNGVGPHRSPETVFFDQLTAAGYYTALIGKTHFEPAPKMDHLDAHTGNADMRAPGTSVVDYLETYLVNQTMDLLDGKLTSAKVPSENQPWFVHTSFVSPHPPLNVPTEFESNYTDGSMPDHLNFGGLKEVASFPNQLRQISERDTLSEHPSPFANGVPNMTYIAEQRRKYYAIANYVDSQVGRLMKWVDDRNLAHNTLVIFTSDHGTTLYSHGLPEKYSYFQGTWEVPMVMRGPGIPAGKRQKGFVSGVDLAPTILGAARVPAPVGMQGFDLYTPIVHGYEYPRSHGAAASLLQSYGLVTKSWKFTYYVDDSLGQLFDRVHDPSEMRNLYGQEAYTEVQRHFNKALMRWSLGLSPSLGWLREHQETAEYGITQYAQAYTANLTGTTAERLLQHDLGVIEQRFAPSGISSASLLSSVGPTGGSASM